MVGAPPLAGLLWVADGEGDGEALDVLDVLDIEGRALIDAEALPVAHGVALALGDDAAVAVLLGVGVNFRVGEPEDGCGDWRGVPVASAVAEPLGEAEPVAVAPDDAVAVSVGVPLGPDDPDVGEFVHVGVSEPDSAEAGSASAVPYTSELTPTDTATAAAARRPRPPADTRFTES